MSTQLLDAVPLTTLSGVGAAISDKLSRIGIHNLQDLLFHLPIRYEAVSYTHLHIGNPSTLKNMAKW